MSISFGVFRLDSTAGQLRKGEAVVPLGSAYAFYVPLNSVLFWYFQNAMAARPALASIIASSVVGLGGFDRNASAL